jgi:hypothetical protein
VSCIATKFSLKLFFFGVPRLHEKVIYAAFIIKIMRWIHVVANLVDRHSTRNKVVKLLDARASIFALLSKRTPNSLSHRKGFDKLPYVKADNKTELPSKTK